jgi:hypothetical protein
MLGVDSQADVAQVDASNDFLSSFLNAYTGNGDTSKLPTVGSGSSTLAQLPTVGSASSTLAQLPLEEPSAPTLAQLPAEAPIGASLPPAMPQPQEQAPSDVDSMVSAFLARN